MHPAHTRRHGIYQGVLWTFLAICSACWADSAPAADLCELKYQSTARGEWAIQRKMSAHFVFRTHRKLLEPPAVNGKAAYFDIAEDAAMDALQLFTTQNYSESEKKGSLVVSRSQAQGIRCGENNWTVFSIDLSNVRWERSEMQTAPLVHQPTPPVLALPKQNNDGPTGPASSGSIPKGSQPSKTTSKTLTTIEE